MITKKLAIGSLALLLANIAFAQVGANGGPTLATVPLEDGGMFALAAACLAIGIRIVRRK